MPKYTCAIRSLRVNFLYHIFFSVSSSEARASAGKIYGPQELLFQDLSVKHWYCCMETYCISNTVYIFLARLVLLHKELRPGYPEVASTLEGQVSRGTERLCLLSIPLCYNQITGVIMIMLMGLYQDCESFVLYYGCYTR